MLMRIWTIKISNTTTMELKAKEMMAMSTYKLQTESKSSLKSKE
jgi:hypothetical protein